MSVRGFCDAAYAIILDEYQRVGVSLQKALLHLAEWAAVVTGSSNEREEELIARRNTEALRSLGFQL